MLGTLLVTSIPLGNVYASAEPTQNIIAAQNQTVIKYTVKSGDTLYLIAKKFGTTISQLKSANGLTTDMLNIG